MQTRLTPAPGAKGDPVRQRGLKVVHVGLKKASINRGDRGVVAVRILGGDGAVGHEGSAEIEFIDEPLPEIFPTNYQQSLMVAQVGARFTAGREERSSALRDSLAASAIRKAGDRHSRYWCVAFQVLRRPTTCHVSSSPAPLT